MGKTVEITKVVHGDCEHKDYCNYLRKYGYCIDVKSEVCPFYRDKVEDELFKGVL